MIPQITINNKGIYSETLNREGSMCNAYSPFKNLQDSTDTIGDFTTNLLNFDLQHPVDIIPQDGYDGSVNLILNDGKNQPRLIGSRFSVIDDGQFKITDHSGFKDTNIYDEEVFDIDTSLKTIAQKIPIVEFSGLTQFAGSLPCGAYTFYFKLADADGNESEVLAESGIVELFIGGLTGDSSINIIQPESMRMGLQDESSGKSITFEITNIDSGFDYVHVLYARSSSSNDQASIDTYHKVIYDYPIVNGKATITITGNEQILGISAEELYVNYADLESVKTQTVINNVLFFGNLNKKERDWDALRIASWKILPSYGIEANVGTLDWNYVVGGPDIKHSGIYYNPYNVYYRVGYWSDELYRFGIVYIFNDNSLSPVFNIQGVDFSKIEKRENKKLVYQDLFNEIKKESYYKQWESEPEDFYFNKQYRLNSRGVIKFPKIQLFELKQGVFKPNPLYINFDLSAIGSTDPENINSLDFSNFCKENDIKGFFFVRQKRIPTILAQGMTIGLTKKEFGAVPVIKDSSGYIANTFLDSYQLIQPEGTIFKVKSANVGINAMLVPDAELSEATFNQLFVSNKHALFLDGSQSFTGDSKNRQYSYDFSSRFSDSPIRRKLTNVQEDVKTLTDGEVYFSTIAGNPAEAYKTADVDKEWNKTAPQNLTSSISLIRGQWGSFVGIGEKETNDTSELKYGRIYNIKSENYVDSEEDATELDFLKRFNSAEHYQAICDRTEINNLESNSIRCYRGDCFQSLFTHRVLRNFIDPELPTNNKIINPACWAQNYAVRCTAIVDADAKYNIHPENEGWLVETQSLYANEIVQAFEVKEELKKAEDSWSWDPEQQYWYKGSKDNPTEITEQLGNNNGTVSEYISENLIKVVKPSEQESGAGGILKNIFKSSKWAVHGLASINRADINAVGLGQWITFPICSSKNLALRDIDYSNATEQASFNRKRSFYPLQKMDIHNPLRDSNIINQAASISLPHKHYYAMPNVPFIKQEYFTRVINSLRDSASSITNEFKVILESAYRDYTKIYGSITKLMPLGSKILVVFQHGLGVLAVNDSMSQAENAMQYLPVELSMIISTTYGSMWKDSVIETQGYIYGVDSVAKIIWRVSGEGKFESLSTMKVEKFLIDNLDMSEFVNKPYVGHVNIKSHYNAFKHDVLFTYYNDILYEFDSISYIPDSTGVATRLSEFKIDSDGYLLDDNFEKIQVNGNFVKGTKVQAEYNDKTGQVSTYVDKINEKQEYVFKWAPGKSWSICFNEVISKFVTFYDWIPIESENIDNIWFSFDQKAFNNLSEKAFNGQLNLTRTPSNSSSLTRDEAYSKYLIDPAFNTTCKISYIDSGKTVEFNNISIVGKTELTAIGVWVKVNEKDGFYTKYSIKIGNEEDNLPDLPEIPGWYFVAILINKGVNNQNFTNVSITANNVKGACTDLIIKNISDNKWLDDVQEGSVLVKYIPNDELSDYYIIRDTGESLQLWKHGEAGIYDNADNIKPTFWYGQQHEFNFEFIARKDAMHKVFNNLQIISNKTEPKKFEFEVVGETYDWHKYKPVLKWIADQVTVGTDNPDYKRQLENTFVEVLTTRYGILKNKKGFPKIFGMEDNSYFEKLPYLEVTNACVPTLDPQIIGEKKGTKDDPNIYLTPEQQSRGDAHSDNTVQCCLVYDKQLNEFRVHTEQLGNNMSKYGRLRGNMQYLEDIWKVEIRPVSFKYAFVSYTINPEDGTRTYYPRIVEDPETGLIYKYVEVTRLQETRHRDKYIKIKVRYSGEDLAVIQAISTLFDYSYA